MEETEEPYPEKETLVPEGHVSEDEIEFVGEGLLRPVLDCIDLVSSDDETASFHLNRPVKDHVDQQKERVASTLDKLARHVEVEKQQRAEKNKAFQEKLDFQHAHGLQELECIKDLPGTSAAKFCVNQWLKMPGVKPGCISSSCRRFPVSFEQCSMKRQPITCPVMHCGRKFDNKQLLLGHLKRFDHSPCDPTIELHGESENSFACLVCLQRFLNMKEFNLHLSDKSKLIDGHDISIPSLTIQCFACPCCFLLYNQREECLKHMSSNSHFKQSIIFKDEKGIPCPIPIPSYAKNVLVGLCKDVSFQIVCTSCRLELRSHVEMMAHFRTQCRKAGPTSISEKSIADVATIFQLKAYCLTCKKALSKDTLVQKHVERTHHKVKGIASIEESVYAFCYVNKSIKTPSDFCTSAANARLKPSILKRTCNESSETDTILLKCKKENETSMISDCHVKMENSIAVTVWFCECCQQFPNEQAVEKHIMTANRISHRCLVCGKLADDLGIIRLHMSRFHGGAHLNNFRFWCQVCVTELPTIENVMTHVLDYHGGHSFYYEQEVFQKPLESAPAQIAFTAPERETSSAEQTAKGIWLCHICEESFDSEETVKQHCKLLMIHQFHKYCCDTCKTKFHKMETLLRHCQVQHNGSIKVKYFCGLCEDLYFEQENEFLSHYEGFHSVDYTFVPNQTPSPTKNPEVSSTTSNETELRLTCGCLQKYISKTKRKMDHRLCLVKLFEKGKLWYSCCFCSATEQTPDALHKHVCKASKESKDPKCVVKCSVCSKSFNTADAGLCHFHMKHCFLEKPHNNFSGTSVSKDGVFTFTASGTSVVTKPVKKDDAHSIQLPYENKGGSPNLSSVMSGIQPCSHETVAMDTDCNDTESELPDLEYLRTMTHIVFIDLDNWAQFFTLLPGYLNQGTFVWGFQGGKTNWKPPQNSKYFKFLYNTGCFFLHPHCSDQKDAADFAICMHAGRLDGELPKQIPFTILSGDKSFLELEGQFKKTKRSAHILDPHHLGGDMMIALLNSISESNPGMQSM